MKLLESGITAVVSNVAGQAISNALAKIEYVKTMPYGSTITSLAGATAGAYLAQYVGGAQVGLGGALLYGAGGHYLGNYVSNAMPASIKGKAVVGGYDLASLGAQAVAVMALGYVKSNVGAVGKVAGKLDSVG